MRQIPNTHWIWLNDWNEQVNGEPALVRFRKTFILEQKPDSLRLKISADTRYKLYVNGALCECGPARGDQRVWYADTVEIAPFLCEGENVLAAEVLRYALAYRSGNFGMVRTATPGLFVEEIGERENPIAADGSWRCRRVPGFRIRRENPGFAPLMFLEDYTADDVDRDWKLAGYDDSGWEAARPYNVMEINEAACPGDLSPRPIPFMRRTDRRLARVVPKYDAEKVDAWTGVLTGTGSVTVPAGETVTVELDAGELTCGYLSLALTGGAGATVDILTSEGYVQRENNPNGAPVKADRLDWDHGYLHGFTDTYRAAGYGTESDPEVYEPFWFRTFRFLGLTVKAGETPCAVTGITYRETGYPLEVRAAASASDPSFDGIWDICFRSLRRCMHETYIDCPFYEQLQYAMDSRNEILYTYAVSGDDRLARQCMDDFRRSQRADGMINCCYPHWGPNVIPSFAIYYILMVHDHMMYFGDRDLVRRHLPAIDGVLGYFVDHLDPRGMVGRTGGHISGRYWSFIDWAVPWGKTVGTPPAGLRGPITMESLLYILGLQRAAELCEVVGRSDTAAEYRDRAAAVQRAVNAYCRDEQGVYLDGPGVREYSQHCQVFAVLTDTVDVKEGRELVLRTLREPEKYAQCTVASMFYLFRALEKIGAYELTDGLWDTWRNMLKNHLTTCVENYIDERSDCHGWGALLLYELPAVILGVRPGAPGYEKVKIAPVPGKLTWAKGDVVTRWGTVHVEWTKREDGSLDLTWEAPEAVRDRIEIIL